MHDVPARLAWLTIAAAFWTLQLLYVVLPIDILPDFIPLIGWTDDAAVILAGLGFTAFGFWRSWPAGDPSVRLTRNTTESLDYEPINPEEIRAL